MLAQAVFHKVHSKHAVTKRCTTGECTLQATALGGTYTPKGRAGGSKNFLKRSSALVALTCSCNTTAYSMSVCHAHGRAGVEPGSTAQAAFASQANAIGTSVFQVKLEVAQKK